MDNYNLGLRIQSIRQKQNLTLKEVADKANITSSMLSQLERGKANPSVETLRKVASALEVPLFAFFAQDNIVPTSHVIRKNEHKKVTFLPAKQVEYTILSPQKNTEIELALMEIYPISQSIDKAMSHVGEEIAYVLEGTVDLTLGSETISLNTGDSVHIPASTVHKWVNNSNNIVKVIFAITPPTF
ncbi:MAG: helix-turn-helix domain-containing protein [Veillonella sp.]|nr:helix-turn-helix domain-containing protein [Veillonella sp.]